MIGVIAQERILGAALGGILSGLVVFYQRRSIYGTISQFEEERPAAAQLEVRKHVPQGRSQITHSWNKVVDQTLGPVIASLSERGW